MYTPAGLFLTSFWSVMCFPFRNTTCDLVSSLVSFIQPQRVRAGADGSCEPGIRQTQVQSGMPLVYNGVCSCQFYRAPRAASKAILQLSCWHETAFRSPHCQVSSAAHFSSLSLRKQNGLSSVRWRAPRLTNNWGWGAARQECVRGTSHRAAVATALGIAALMLDRRPPLPGAPRLPLLLRCCRTEQLLQAEPQPLFTENALWPPPGVAVTTALTSNCVERSLTAEENAWMLTASSA